MSANIEWKQKLIRIRPDYFKVCSFLEFVADRNNVKKNIYFDNLFNYSLDYLMKNGFNYHVDVYKPVRKGKGFFLKIDTLKKFNIVFDGFSKYFFYKQKRKMTLAEFTELLLYVYVTAEINAQEAELIDIDWGIRRRHNSL